MNNRRSDNDQNKLLYDPNQANLRRLGTFSNVQNYDDEELDNDDEIENQDENIEDSSPSSSTLDNVKALEEGQVNNVIKNESKKAIKQVAVKGKAVASALGKKLITLVASNPWILIILAGLILFIFIFLIIIFVIGGGTNSTKYGLYGYDYIQLNNLCETVKVYNPKDGTYTSELDFETEYIPGVVNAEVGMFSDAPELLKLFSIAARTYFLSQVDSSCTIEGSTKKQAFTFNEALLKSVTEEGSVFREAADATYGLVVGKNGSLITTYYDAACYMGEDDSDFFIGYGSITLGESHIQNIPKSWAQTQSIMDYINKSKENNKLCYKGHGYGISQYGAYYLSTVDSYDLEQLLEYYMGDVQLYSIYESVGTNYTTETDGSGTNILDVPLRDFLASEGTSVEAFNEYILANVLNVGVGTRNAAVVAATSLVGSLYDYYGVKLPYTLCGQHDCNDMYANGVNVNRVANSFYGVDPNWGSKISSNINDPTSSYYYSGKAYKSYGPDCSGFIAWVFHNSGFTASSLDSASQGNLGKKYPVNSSFRGKPGDLLWKPGHIMFIVGVDETEGAYYIAHASGGSSGVKISKVSFSSSGIYVVDMTDWYSKNSLGYTSEKFTELYRNGYIDGYTGKSTNLSIGVDRDIYLVGDSRTVGLCSVNSLCSSQSECNTNMCLAKVGQGYTWFTNNLSKIRSSSKSNIVINMGVNDLTGDASGSDVAEKYYNSIKSLSSNSKTIYVVSVNPVNNYSNVSNTTIESFNTKMKNLIKSGNSNIKYIDTYNNVTFNTTDGLHYDSDTYKKLYEYILKEVK